MSPRIPTRVCGPRTHCKARVWVTQLRWGDDLVASTTRHHGGLNCRRTLTPKAHLCCLWRVLSLQPFTLCPPLCLRRGAGQHAVTQPLCSGQDGRLQAAELFWKRPGAPARLGWGALRSSPSPARGHPLCGWLGAWGAVRLDPLRGTQLPQEPFGQLAQLGLPHESLLAGLSVAGTEQLVMTSSVPETPVRPRPPERAGMVTFPLQLKGSP